MADRPQTIGLVVGEESGDALGADLMVALRAARPDTRFVGVAGERMMAEGMESLFPIADVAVMGYSAVLARMPLLVRRVRQTVRALLAEPLDALVIIDSPGFTHAVAKRVAPRRPALPIVNHVSPSVWVWKSYRARQMVRYVDHVLALLPFEPDVHRRLGGPPCTYVGHPLISKLDRLRPAGGPLTGSGEPPVLAVLPGSRRSEVDRLMAPFGKAVGRIAVEVGPIRVVLPAVSHLRDRIETASANWPLQPDIVAGEDAKYAAIRSATAALAASGTVTLELALAGVPTVAAYRPERILLWLRRFAALDSFILPNIILGEKIVPEVIAAHIDETVLADAVLPLLSDTPERRAQRDAFTRLDEVMMLEGGETPGDRAARIVLDQIASGPVRPTG